jgi:predicted dehydrogenase
MTAKDHEYNIGVVGYRFSAKVFNIPFITTTPGLKLYAIVQRHPTEDNNAKKDHAGVKVYNSAEELVVDPAVHAVVITSTPDAHYQQAKLALQHKKSVIIEKPFCATFQEANELVLLAKQQGLALSIYQNRRFDTDLITLQKLIEDGALGRVVEFETHVDRHTPALAKSWKSEVFPGGGAIYDLGSHLFDQVVLLFGLPKQITSFVGTQRTTGENSHGFGDYFTVHFHYNNGMVATAKTNIVSPESKYLRFWVRGDKGTYKKYHLDIQETQLGDQNMKATDSNYAREPEEYHGILDQVQADGTITSKVVPTQFDVNWRTYYVLFKRALDGDGPVPVPADIPAQVVRLIELAIVSSETGKTISV